MSRPALLFYQVMWRWCCWCCGSLQHMPVFGVVLLPPFFFSNPLDVGSQIVAGSRPA